MVFRYEHGLGVVREVSVSWNWRLSIVFGKHWSVFGCGLGGVCQREVILIFLILLGIFLVEFWYDMREVCLWINQCWSPPLLFEK